MTLVLVLSMAGCSKGKPQPTPSSTPSSTAQGDKYTQQADFDVFTDEIFKHEVQNDSITLNYTLANPENFGINDFVPTFGTFSVDEMKQSFKESKDTLTKLEAFNYDLLSQSQQVTYDILKELLSADLSIEDYILYNEILSPTTGFQAQLPVLLAEFNFYTKDDVYNYIKLLECTKTYFDQISTFQRQKSEAGFFMSDTTADDIIDQCKQFIKNPEENYLISIFNEKIETFDFTKEEKVTLMEDNKKAILENVIPAYEQLIQTLTSLKGTGTNEGGLSNYENGKEYYQYLLKQNTGSSKTVDEINALLDKAIATSILGMQSIAATDANALESASNLSYKLTDPKEILDYLEDSIKEDFPELEPVNCTIKYVHESLEEHMSPAFYLTPPIDNFTENSVYINKNEKFDLSTIFTTIAHEGYPGHLYQTVYYHQQYPSLIRSLIDFGGYSEGWATYVEVYSYGLAGLDENVAKIMQYNLVATLCMYAKVDIYVNYYGWDKAKVKTYLTDFGLGEDSIVEDMFNAMVAEPCNYLKYTLGYLEIDALKEKAEKALGDQFVLKDFHTFFLNLGPAQFDIIDKYLEQWISSHKTEESK